jgi:chromosome segregation ATPase
VAKLSNPVTGIESGRQKASEEIGEKFEKERIKSDTEWAKKYQMNEIDKKLAQLDQDLKNIGTASLETAEDIEKWDEQLKKNRKELEEWGQKQKTDPNFDVVAFNKRSKILEADNANLDKQISLAKKGGEDARNAKKMSFEAEKLKLENEKKGLKDKKDRDELIKGLGELVKKEGDSGHAAPTAAAAVPSPVPTAPSGGGGH